MGEREAGESDEKQLNVIKPKIGLAGTTRGSPSLVNGVRLRTSSLRGSRVRIPPPALRLLLRTDGSSLDSPWISEPLRPDSAPTRGRAAWFCLCRFRRGGLWSKRRRHRLLLGERLSGHD